MAPWVPLHVHSQYSLLDSTASIEGIVEKGKSFQMESIALTDQGNMFGAIDFYKTCTSLKIKPILGCEMWVAPGSRLEKKKLPGMPAGFPLILLAKNLQGYHNLCKLSSLAYLEGFYYYPRVDKELLERWAEGIICLSGPTHGKIASLCVQEDEKLLKEEITWFQKVYKENFYFEIQRHEMSPEQIEKDEMQKESWLVQNFTDFREKQEKVISTLLHFSKELSIPLVATNDSHYLSKEDWRAHEVLLNVQSGEPCEIWERDSMGNPKTRIANPKRQVYPSHSFSFPSPEEMKELFSDLPDALEKSLHIASCCDCVLDFKTKHYPVFIPPHLEGQKLTKKEREKAAEDYLFDLCIQGIEKRYSPEKLAKVQEKYPDKEPLKVVRERLDYEFEVLSSKAMCDYLLIVHDFIAWAKNKGIPVGPGRGSAAGSIIAYLIGITDIEPLRFHLFFERFINPERISYPDIDVDICMERRSEVIEYMLGKYGYERVAQIITFGTMKAKMAIKDVGRVLSVPLAKVNQIAKLVPDDLNITLEKALEIDQEFRQFCSQDQEAKMVVDMAQKIEGSIRNTSIHAAGMIVSEKNIMENIPVCKAKDSDMLVTQYAMKPVESVGMLKIDLLGLKTLTSIQKAAKAIEKKEEKALDWIDLPLNDQNTFNLLNQGKTLGVFQLESAGMQELAKQLHIDNFEEIIAVGALYRPGPMDQIPSFINRKHGKEAIELDHPLLKEILQETYGVMVYQEQVMQIASKLAGYTLGEGDVLRRAMGKKDRAEMARQRKKFLQGAKERGIDEKTAVTIFDHIEKFASYGFNKSHAAAYAFLSYVTAYLKANYPKEWMAALMTCDRDDLSKVSKFIRECQSMEIAILPPDVNEAGAEFVATSQGIRFAMTGIKGIGQAVVEAIVEEREKKGPYLSLEDFIKRIDTKRVGKKQIEILIDAGGMDFTSWTRDAMRQSVEGLYDQAAKSQREASQGVLHLFSLLEEKPLEPPKVVTPSLKKEILQREKELLGFYLTGHPMEEHAAVLQKLFCTPLKELETLGAEEVRLIRCAFILEDVQFKISAKNQRKFAILTISDGHEKYQVPIWPEMYAEKGSLFVENHLFFALFQAEKKDGLRLQCRYLEELERMSEAKIHEAERVYDQTKTQIKKGGSKRKPQEGKMEKKESLLQLDFDIENLCLSQMLALKKIFRSYTGATPVELIFFSDEEKVSKLSISSEWGVRWEKGLEHELQKLSGYIDSRLIDLQTPSKTVYLDRQEG